MLEAERALATGSIEQAERLYLHAVEADGRNVIAVVGLGRVALERGDERTARVLARQALELDPENAAARRLLGTEIDAAEAIVPDTVDAGPRRGRRDVIRRLFRRP
jgi:cytochrome c-type biogenesis protein CcmH/NrfG